mmetsp:Transcript_4499/g.12594  ORF Transcript_4499/g.12594 Transcript_4499/m.12594 type:complete len:389 (+) Transcript_4499:45-1211(+)
MLSMRSARRRGRRSSGPPRPTRRRRSRRLRSSSRRSSSSGGSSQGSGIRSRRSNGSKHNEGSKGSSWNEAKTPSNRSPRSESGSSTSSRSSLNSMVEAAERENTAKAKTHQVEQPPDALRGVASASALAASPGKPPEVAAGTAAARSSEKRPSMGRLGSEDNATTQAGSDSHRTCGVESHNSSPQSNGLQHPAKASDDAAPAPMPPPTGHDFGPRGAVQLPVLLAGGPSTATMSAENVQTPAPSGLAPLPPPRVGSTLAFGVTHGPLAEAAPSLPLASTEALAPAPPRPSRLPMLPSMPAVDGQARLPPLPNTSEAPPPSPLEPKGSSDSDDSGFEDNSMSGQRQTRRMSRDSSDFVQFVLQPGPSSAGAAAAVVGLEESDSDASDFA